MTFSVTTYGQAALLCITLVLASCGGGGSGSNTQQPSGSSTPPPPAQNNAPVGVNLPRQVDETAIIGFAYDYDIYVNGTAFRDADGDALTYEVQIGPSAPSDVCELSAAGTHLKGTPTKLGRCGVQVRGTDGRGGEVHDGFLVYRSTRLRP